MELDSDYSEVISDISDPKKGDGEFPYAETDKSCLDTINLGNMGKSGSNLDDEGSTRKRKREDHTKMLSWILNAAKDPHSPDLGSLPMRSKWKNYGKEQLWKQVLIAREMMFSETNGNLIFNQLPADWRKKPMHPSMYEENQKEKEKVRSSQRVIAAKELKSKYRAPSEASSGVQSDLEEDFIISIPVGPRHQADLPEWRKEAYESEDKWLGSKVWPLQSEERKKCFAERERTGKGRQDSCGCQFQGSVECVRFHVSEKRNRMKLQLGSAFSTWKFNKMGEEVALSWTQKEEKRFQRVIKTNPPSLGKCYWDEIDKAFPNKKKEELVSYFFNVFVLQRRAYQNRSTPGKIDSDDEESKFGSLGDFRHETGKCPSSIFYSPKRSRPHF